MYEYSLKQYLMHFTKRKPLRITILLCFQLEKWKIIIFKFYLKTTAQINCWIDFKSNYINFLTESTRIRDHFILLVIYSAKNWRVIRQIAIFYFCFHKFTFQSF